MLIDGHMPQSNFVLSVPLPQLLPVGIFAHGACLRPEIEVNHRELKVVLFSDNRMYAITT